MAEYKVIFRDEKPDWQENCPILLEAVQVSRDTNSSAAFLQLKVRNISDAAIGSIAIETIVTSPGGDSETVQSESLDADIAPNAIFRPHAVRLSNSEVKSVSAQVTRVDSMRSFHEAISVPDAQPLALSAQALAERNQRLSSMGCLPKKMRYRHHEGNGWWICSCGALNITEDRCLECGIEKTKLTDLEDEALLEEQATERRYLEASEALSGSSVPDLEKAKATFGELGQYKDSAALIGRCDELIASLREGRSRKTKVGIIAVAAVVAVVAAIVFVSTVLMPKSRLDEAMRKADSGDYEAAVSMCTELNDWDAVNQVQKKWADSLFSEGKYDDALGHYNIASDNEGVFRCAAKLSEAGDTSKAINVLEPLVSQGYEGAEAAMNEAKYAYVNSNYNNTDATTCKYLLELKGKGYKDAQALCDKLYALSVSSHNFTCKPRGRYNYVLYEFTVEGTMPGGMEDRTVSVYDSASEKTTTNVLKVERGKGRHRISQLIDGGAHSATVRITDDSTGAVLLEDTISF